MTDQTRPIEVRCAPSGAGWRCVVTVGEDAGATTHEVGVTAEDLARLAPEAGVERLVRESFGFMLEREPRESILRRFDLPEIGRYFPEFEAEIGRRL